MMARRLFALLALAFFSASASAQACFQSSIMSPSPFMGNHGEIFKTADGSLWEVQHEYSYLYEYYPNVIVCPARGKLAIKGKTLNIAFVGGTRPKSSAPSQTPEVIETHIDGDFSGWEGETIFKLRNGQVWQQASYAYAYSYKYAPKVLIFRTGGGYEMQVEGMDQRIRVNRLQ